MIFLTNEIAITTAQNFTVLGAEIGNIHRVSMSIVP